MAQRKTPSTPSKKPGARPATGGRQNARPVAGSRPNARPAAAASAKSGGRPPTRKPGKSIVNQKQTPWGLIITTIVLVLFAAGIVAFAVTRSSSSSNSTNAADKSYVQPEIAAAKAIKGVIYKAEPNHTHVAGTVKYNTTPPTGGDHSPIWADCQGTVYTHQIANENAVHMLEHGAVWITYNPKTATTADITALKAMVDGVDRTALSPFVGLKTPISLQAWDYQLFVSKATDPRVSAFIDALRANPKTTPENASCQAPTGWDAAKSTLGHPVG